MSNKIKTIILCIGVIFGRYLNSDQLTIYFIEVIFDLKKKCGCLTLKETNGWNDWVKKSLLDMLNTVHVQSISNHLLFRYTFILSTDPEG